MTSGRFWQPDVTVATVVVSDGRLLLVEEAVNGAWSSTSPPGIWSRTKAWSMPRCARRARKPAGTYA